MPRPRLAPNDAAEAQARTRAYHRAQGRALSTLRARHRDEYEAELANELALEGIEDRRPYTIRTRKGKGLPA